MKTSISRTELREQFVTQLDVVKQEEANLKSLELDALTRLNKSVDADSILDAKQAVRDQQQLLEFTRERCEALKAANRNFSRL